MHENYKKIQLVTWSIEYTLNANKDYEKIIKNLKKNDRFE